ncbi:MAG TPA: hypothetical protein DCX53_06080 [Anaerolineae bacterium]|nr:hypothetical protein [Anaerolineae bacterium]
MLSSLQRFFQAPIYDDDPEKNQDSLTTHRVGVALIGLYILSTPMILLLESPAREFVLAISGAGITIWLVTIQLVKRDQRFLAKIIILALNTLVLFSVLFFTGGFTQSTVFTFLFLLALANLLFPRRGSVVYGSILLVLVLALYVLDLAGIVPESSLIQSTRTNILVFLFTLVSITIVMAFASDNFQKYLEIIQSNEKELQEQNIELDQLGGLLESKVTERTAELDKRANQLEAILSVARATASLQNLDDLLPAITRLVSQRFAYYHVGIFIVEEGDEFIGLKAANSDGGRKMLNREYKLNMDENSIVGFTISRGEPRIALDVGADSVFFDNPDLPETRSELALPLHIGDRVIGALDVQSTVPNAFTVADIALLSTLADQIAIAIENARLFSETREALKKTEESFAQYVRQEWSEFARQAKTNGYRFDGTRILPLDGRDNHQMIKELPKTGVLSLEKDSHELSIPIRFRGQIIGMFEVKSKSGARKWTTDEVALLEAAAERTALALENSRLVESSQRRASRERTIGDISTKIGAVSDIDVIMQIAVEELGRKISGTAEVTFELDPKTEARQN